MRNSLILVLLYFVCALAAEMPPNDTIHYPDHMGIRTIQSFGAKGDGVHDDTAALREAINTTGHTYFPNGVYRVSEPVFWNLTPRIGPTWQGESREGVIIRLAPDAREFGNPDKPRAMIAFIKPGGKSADFFKFNVADMTFDTGDHPGAIGVRFHSNNNGMIRNVAIRGAGRIGLDLSSGHNGPLLVQDVLIEGFDIGLKAGAGPYNSQTVNGLILRGQKEWGIHNETGALFLRDVESHNTVPAVFAQGTTVLVDAHLRGTGAEGPAITAVDNFFARNVEIQGYEQGVRTGETYRDEKKRRQIRYGETHNGGGLISEFTTSDGVRGLLPGQTPRTLNLEVPDVSFPAWPATPGSWVFVGDFGAVPDDDTGDADAIQRAIDHAAERGAETVSFRANATYILDRDIRIHGSVKRLQGAATYLRPAEPKTPVRIVVARQDGPDVFLEGLDRPLGRYELIVEHEGGRDLYLRRIRARLHMTGPGRAFSQDAVYQMFLHHPQAEVYGWQVNPESGSETNIVNEGGTLWILGLKTERNQVYIDTIGGGRTEVLGAWLYNTLSTDPAPHLFSAVESDLSLAGVAYYNYWGRKYPRTVHIIRNGRDLSLTPEDLAPQIGIFSTR